MNSGVSDTPATEMAGASAAVANLRAFLILLVLAIHSVLAYVSYLPAAPYAFDRPPFSWRSVPIIDPHRMIGFDIFSAWLDIFVMALFFLLSGLFAWQSVARKGPAVFVRDRVLRLGLPCAVAVLLLMPIALFPSYLQTAVHPGIADYWHSWRGLPFWPNGPMWFLWVLLIADVAVAGIYVLLGRNRAAVPRLSSYAAQRGPQFLAWLLLASAIAYIPLALLYGPMPWFNRGPFSFQLSRPGQYGVYFFAGVFIGACGPGRSLLMRAELLARRWRLWLAAAVTTFVLWLAVAGRNFVEPAPAPLAWRVGEDLTFVLACFSGAFCTMAMAMRFARLRTPLLESLQNNSYGIYLIHYVFVVWLQFELLGADWPAVAKAPIVFAGTLALSWIATSFLRRLPGFAVVIGGKRRPLVFSQARTMQAHGPIGRRGRQTR
jgi:hypothetical protein